LRSPLIVRLDPDFVQVEERARWKANARRETGSLVSTDERAKGRSFQKNCRFIGHIVTRL
jgi:hypothetical protein